MSDFKCDVCNRQYKEIARLNQHMEASHAKENNSERIVCDFCNKSFTSPLAKQQHIDASHNPTKEAPEVVSPTVCKLASPASVFGCMYCNRSYQLEDALHQHIRVKHPDENVAKQQVALNTSGKVLCNGCNRSFSTDGGLQDHVRQNHPELLSPDDRSKLTKRKLFPCNECNDSFDSEAALLQHAVKKHDDLSDGMAKLNIKQGEGQIGNEHVCITCYNRFDTKASAVQHTAVKKDHVIKLSTRELAVQCFLKAAQVEGEDKQESVALFTDILKKIINHVRSNPDGKVYSPDIARAGSTAANVKIGKADEFDTNIPLNIAIQQLYTDGSLNYIYKDKQHEEEGQKSKVNMNIDRQIITCDPRKIPDGQAVVKVNTSQVPAKLVYGDDLIPHKCQKDLYDRVKAAIDHLKLDQVKLSKEAHGPAITLTIVPEEGHYISVDLTLSLACNLKLSNYDWPRDATKLALKPEKIAECTKAPIHLVPKGGDTWSISFSKVEETLLKGIDTGNECRRHVMQIMKRHLQMCSSSSRKGLDGISSYIIKQQLMWSAEKHTDSGYWNQKNMAKCVIDVMGDFLDTLKARRLPNYFKPSVNILEHKRLDILMVMVEYFEKERSKLLKMEA